MQKDKRWWTSRINCALDASGWSYSDLANAGDQVAGARSLEQSQTQTEVRAMTRSTHVATRIAALICFLGMASIARGNHPAAGDCVHFHGQNPSTAQFSVCAHITIDRKSYGG